MSLTSAHGIEKSHGPHRVLGGVSVTIAEGSRIGLVGNNGSGKTTLARILARLDVPDAGEVMRRRGIRVGYLAQVPDVDPGQTVLDGALAGLEEWRQLTIEYEALTAKLAGETPATSAAHDEWLQRQATVGAEIERLGGWEQEHRARSILQRLGVSDLSALMGSLSGGERRRVALAALLVSEPQVLILDEPTNHLDTDSIDWLERYLLESFKGALLTITHDRYFLDRVVTKTWEASEGQIHAYEGGWEAYLTARAEREAQEARTESNRKNFLRTELEWLRRQPKARGTKQKARTARAEAALEGAVHDEASLNLEAVSQRQGAQVLEFRGLGFDIGDRCLIQALDLILMPGQRLGIIGANGCGKTTLLRMVLGEQGPTRGEVLLGKNTQIAYFAQTRIDLDDRASVAENVAGRQTTVTVGARELTLYSYLERFSFRGEEIRKKVGVLSGGERARVALAKLLLQPANLLVLDEPTNDLDVATMSALESMLRDFAGSVLVVTHDRYFLDRVVTSILAFEGQGRVTHTIGDYGNYIRLREQRQQRESSTASVEPASEAPAAAAAESKETSVAARPPKLTYKQTRELETMEATIESAESEVSRLEQELADPELYRTAADRAALLGEQLHAAQARVQALMDRWQELESQREAFEAGK